MNPRIFISCVSAEFRTIRSKVEEAVRHLGYEPVTMANWSAGHGELLAWLRAQIGSCEGVIHIIGTAYGAEPPHHNPLADGIPNGPSRYSYTQYEFLYATAAGKKTWVIQPGKACTRDTPFDRLDFPSDPAVIDSGTHQSECRRLQAAHVGFIKDGNYLRQRPADDKDLQILIGKLRDHAAELRLNFSHWQEFIAGNLGQIEASVGTIQDKTGAIKKDSSHLLRLAAIILAVLFLIGTGGWFAFQHLRKKTGENTQAIQSALSDPIVLRAKLEKQARAKAEEKIAPLRNKPGAWREVHEIQRQCDLAIASLDDLIERIGRNLAEDAHPVYVEAAQILERDGADAALEFLELKRPKLLDKARNLNEQQEELEKEKRQTLKPVGLESALLETNLEWEQALALREETARLAPKWWEARQDMGRLYYDLARWQDAERELRAAQSLATGPKDEAISINILAGVFQGTNRFAEAETLLVRALAMGKQSYGPAHPIVANASNNLAYVFKETGHFKEAEPLFRQALEIHEKSLGADHAVVATDLNNLAELLRLTNRLDEAEPLYRRAMAIDKRVFGKSHPNLAIDLNNLCLLLQEKGSLKEAEDSIRQALAIDENAFPKGHPCVARDLNNLSSLLLETKRLDEAEVVIRRALAIDEQFFGKEHSDVARDLSNLGGLLQTTGRLAEAEPEFRRALGIAEQCFGKDHFETAVHLNNLSVLLQASERCDEAEALMRRAVAIEEKTLGKDHPDVGGDLANLASLLNATKRVGEAEALARRALVIFLKFKLQSSREHPQFRQCFKKYLAIIPEMNLATGEGWKRLVSLGSEAGWKQENWEQELSSLMPHSLHSASNAADEKLTQAFENYQQGRFGEAANLFRQILDLNREDPSANAIDTGLIRMNLAASQIGLGHFAEAKAALVSLVSEFETEKVRSVAAGRANHHLGRCYLQLDDRSNAAAHFHRAIEIYESLDSRQFSKGLLDETRELFRSLSEGNAKILTK